MQLTLRTELKRLFRDYRTMTPKLESRLDQLGFFVIRKKRHVILCYSNPDGQQMHIPLSSTSSDKRAGLNMASKIANSVCMHS